MPAEAPTVSVVIIFKDEERFLAEAIDSVRAQTFADWELLLVDDGSTDGSSEIARMAAAGDQGCRSEGDATVPGLHRVRYLEHPGHANRGMSASRNLGVVNAVGRYVASLDGDDVWLPGKLASQVAALDRHPDAAMVYSPLLRWRTWTADPDAADHEDLMGVGRKKFGTHPLAGRVVDPPQLARLMLKDDYFIPGGALIRRPVLHEVGLYEERFRTLYEDAVVMMKIALRHPIVVCDDVGYLYRMHPASSTNQQSAGAQIDVHRAAYLDWVDDHLGSLDEVPPALRRDLRRARRSTHARRQLRHRVLTAGRTAGRLVLPLPVRDELRRRWRDRTRPVVTRP